MDKNTENLKTEQVQSNLPYTHCLNCGTELQGMYKDEAKEECKNKPADVKFVIPSTVPPLNEATRWLVERAKTEAKK